MVSNLHYTVQKKPNYEVILMSDDLKIVGLLCNWCCYGGADTAGTARMQYPPNVRIIRVMCSGRITPSMVFKAFQEGADRALGGGSHIGD